VSDAETPTAINLLKREVMRFLASDEPEVLCIRGQWGVGKTYAWREFLKEAKNNDAIGPSKYAYVSLFGVQSLEQMKNAIFENTVHRSIIDTAPSLETVKENVLSFGKHLGRQGYTKALEFSSAYFGGVRNAIAPLQSLSFHWVRSQLICIDDLERKGKDLRIVDVLGLISFLREHRNCKIVLILNDAQLDNPDQAILAKYHEKVIDTSLLYAPTEEDCIEIAFKDTTLVGALIPFVEFCKTLGIDNIRVIKRIERLVLKVEPLLKKFHDAVLRQAVQSLTLFGWAYFSKKDDLLDFSVRRRGHIFDGIGDEKMSEDEKTWDTMLEAYGFGSTDELDAALLDGIKNGFFDEDLLVRKAERLHEQHRDNASRAALESAWRTFHDTFDNNDNQVIPRIIAAARAHISHVTPINLSGTMKLLKGVGEEKEALELLAHFIKSHEGSRETFDLDSNPFGYEIDDPHLRAAFAEKLVEIVDERDPSEILIGIDADKSWGAKDIEVLSRLSADDFYKLFKSTKAIDLRRSVRAALYLGRGNPSEPQYAQITQRATEALKRISKDSPVNKMRVIKFGINE
jgi:hypothetical protein